MIMSGRILLGRFLYECFLVDFQHLCRQRIGRKRQESATEATVPCSCERCGRILVSRVGELLFRMARDQACNQRHSVALLDAVSIQSLLIQGFLQWLLPQSSESSALERIWYTEATGTRS
jgi:hypothetical protein